MAGSGLYGSNDAPLMAHHDMALLDLDGVVYLVGDPIAGAAQTIQRIRETGTQVRFVTNNASRAPDDVAKLLTSRGISAQPQEVCTSAQAAAQVLHDRCAPGSHILVIGSEALEAEVKRVGLVPQRGPDGGDVAAVVQGFGSEVAWTMLAEAAVTVRGGALWVATNTDKTMPSARGPLPGNGTMVAAVAAAAGKQPDVIAGKPGPELLKKAISSDPTINPIMVGDRWDTDISAAVAAGIPSLMVLSGSTQAKHVLTIPVGARPNYLSWTVAGLYEIHPRPVVREQFRSVECCEWTVTVEGATVLLDGGGEPLDALRALAVMAWSLQDSRPDLFKETELRALTNIGAKAIRELGIDH